MTEPRTVREVRDAVRRIEADLERLSMADGMALLESGHGWNHVAYRIRAARLALRQADIAAAKVDDPRAGILKPLSAQIRKAGPRLRPARKRYRCTNCFREALLSAESAEKGHRRIMYPAPGYREVVDCGDWEPIARLRKR